MKRPDLAIQQVEVYSRSAPTVRRRRAIRHHRRQKDLLLWQEEWTTQQYMTHPSGTQTGRIPEQRAHPCRLDGRVSL